MTYDEFPDPVPVIREWIKRNRPADALTLSQFNGLATQAAARDPIGEGMIAWLSIAFAAGREYGETYGEAASALDGNTSLSVTHTSMAGGEITRRKVIFRAETTSGDSDILLAIESTINADADPLRAHVTVEES